MGKGLVHVYTGNGKGKTTAAVGLGIRAFGRGFRVLMLQFLKEHESGELVVLKRFEPDFVVKRCKTSGKFTWNMNDSEMNQAREAANSLFQYAVETSQSGKWEMVILDEIFGAIKADLIDVNDVLKFIQNKDENLEIVLTGRDVPKEVVEISHYVSEINALKHPFTNGTPARIGIEY